MNTTTAGVNLEDIGTTPGGARLDNFNQDQENQMPTAGGGAGTAAYKFSPEELRVLKECNRESFYYRCVPFGGFLGTGVYYAVQAGYLSASPRFGALPKVFGAVLIGYFVGKFSYQQKCVEKIMALPNSQLGEMLRKQKNARGGSSGGFEQVVTLQDPILATASSYLAPSPDSADIGAQFSSVGDVRPMQSFDQDANIFGGVDYDSNSEANESQMKQIELPAKPNQEFTTYDNLRKQNRAEFEVARSQHIKDSAENQMRAQRRNTSPQQPQQTQEPVGKRKNIYGDVWDDKAD